MEYNYQREITDLNQIKWNGLKFVTIPTPPTHKRPAYTLHLANIKENI